METIGKAITTISAQITLAATVFALPLIQCFETTPSTCSQGEDCSSAPTDCGWDGECDSGTICEDYLCVEGCRLNEDCALAQVCNDDDQCLDVESECACHLAEDFSGEDIHPQSSTFGQTVGVPDTYENGVALFFGSVTCGVCRRILDSLIDIRTELENEGEQPELLFVQGIMFEVTSEEVGELLGSVDVAVVENTESANIWMRYHAAQYGLAIVDRHGCLTESYDDLDRMDLSGDSGDEIAGAWRQAMAEECPDSSTASE